MTKQEALYNYILRIADNNMLLGQRLSELCGHGPFLEQDIATSNIALDLIGQSNALYTYAAQVEGKGRTEDDLAFLRTEREFYNTLLVEQPNIDFAHVMVRQFFVDAFNLYFFQELAASKDITIAAIAAKSNKEISYHIRHSSSWIERLGDGTKESNTRTQNAINALYRFTGELFEMNAIDELLIKEGVAVNLMGFKSKWDNLVKETFVKSNLTLPENTFMQRGGKEGKHSEYMGHILAEMQYLQRSFPGAKW
ncbi:MAG: phenylacetate-CoA oxygenase subunit PaaC [Bacteroidetes bacterium]|nr:phenylacetate-CoA oxygenase subunit PaaC [Bacteroidota bacterium]